MRTIDHWNGARWIGGAGVPARTADVLGAERYTVVEQDMYPCDFGKPKPIAERTFTYLNASGAGHGGAA